ncbi:Kinesin- protein 12, partial [Coelomomyces lativittatus]
MTGAEIISPDSQGIIPRSLAHIYHMIKQNSLRKFKVRTSFLEVYNEQMYDLLTPSNTILPLRWRKKQGFYAENAIIVE